MEKVIADDLIIWPDEVEGALERPRFKTYFDPDDPAGKPVSSWVESPNTNDREISEDENEYDLSVLNSGMNAEGGRSLDRLFGTKTFAYPKPLSLVRSLVRSSAIRAHCGEH
jgi:adenine-specific DNA-methyltransferase